MEISHSRLMTERIDVPLMVGLHVLPKVSYNDEGSSGIKSEMSNIDVSIPVGASYEWRNIVVDARYHFGLMHAIKNQDVRRRYLLLTVGYRFGL
jgi:hypothetical protein